MWLWNRSDNMALFVLLLDFGTVPTVWNYLFFYRTLELFRQYGFISFSIGLWYCFDSVVSFVYLLDFGTVPTVWHHLLFNWNFSESVALLIFHFSIGFWNCCDSVALFFFYGTLNCSDSVPLFGFLLDFGNVPTMWHYWFFIFALDFETVPILWHYCFVYGTIELFWQCAIICFYMGLWYCFDSVVLFVYLLDFATVPTV